MERKVSELGLTCKYPEWMNDDDMYPDWDHSNDCQARATSAILFEKSGRIWSYRCDKHRNDMEDSSHSERAIFTDSITTPP